MSARRALAFAASTAAAAALIATPLASGRGTEVVGVADDYFDPGSITIKAGTKLSFNWIGENQHEILKAKGPGGYFESGPIEGTGVEFKHRFKKAGTYKLLCSLHEEMRMKVKVTD